MTQPDSIFGAELDRLKRLLTVGKDEPDDGPGEQTPRTASFQILTERPGGHIGRYKLLSILGEGGMGIVYLAEQEQPIKRRVALKVIKPGMDSKRVIARFEAERQALALLDHPNIAHVNDAGTTENGRPYFVMEYVKGQPITEHCDDHKLTIEDRLNLFRQVCLALHHAHQKGIIHRDIKPSNILVSIQDDKAVPKIIDFGVAKALAQPLTERTVGTEDSQLLGTPEYMSPEQADMANVDIDIRSDIYSLGVLLYVLLTGVLPFDSDTLRTGGIENIRQIIRETNPKTPSTRLTKLGDEATVIAQNRRMEIHTLARHLRKELEWIPLKAMRKERAERYRSASELADDIQNYLKGAPLIAGPPGKGYKLKKLVQRNRVLVGGIAAVLVVLIGGVVVSAVFAIGQARALADTRLVVDFLKNDVLGSAKEARAGEVVTAGYLLDAGSSTLGDKFKDRPLLEAEIHETLAWTYRSLNEWSQAEQHFQRVIEIYQKQLGEAHPDTLKVMNNIGWIYLKQSRYEDMEQLFTKLVQIQREVHGVEHPIGDVHGLAVASYALGKYKQAESLFDELLQIVPSENPFIIHIKGNLAVVYLLQCRYDKAEQLLTETIRSFEDREDLADVVYSLKRSLAVTHTEQGRYKEAERLFEEILKALRLLKGDKHSETLSCMLYFAQLHTDQKHYNEAEDLLQEALSIARERPEEHRLLLSFKHALAVLRTRQGQYGEAEKLFDEALNGRQREVGNDHPHTLKTLNDFGVLRREQHRYDEAESLLRQSLEGRIKLDPNHRACFETMHELAVLYKEQGDYNKAEQLLLKAVEGRRIKLGDNHPHTLESIKKLIDLYEAWNKPEKVEEWRAKLPQTEAVTE
jgi:serine/threonine protein kinase/Flp pilus assembly protein TadD